MNKLIKVTYWKNKESRFSKGGYETTTYCNKIEYLSCLLGYELFIEHNGNDYMTMYIPDFAYVKQEEVK